MSIPFYFWFPILVSSGIGFLAISIPPVADQFMHLFGFGYGGLSLLLGAYYWTHSLIQVPAGILVDRIGPMQALLTATCVSISCCLLPLLSPENFALAAATRMVLGICSGVLFLTAVKIIKLVTPPRYISRVQGVQGAASALGSLLPYLTLPYLGPYGWMASYILCALFFMSFFYGAYKLPLRAMRRTRTPQTMRQTWNAVKVIGFSRNVWFLGCCHGLTFGTLLTVIGNWLPSILMDAKPGTSIETWGVITSVLLLMGTVGRAFSGDLMRKVPRGRILAVVPLVMAAGHFAFAFSPGVWGILAASAILAPVCGLTFASIFTLTTDTAPPSYVATAVGFMNMVANLVNTALVLSLGIIRDLTGSFSVGLLVTGFAALIFWFFARKITANIESV